MACTALKVNVTGVKVEVQSIGKDVTGGTPNSALQEVCCIDGTVDIDFGEYPIDKIDCLQGTTYEKGSIMFGTGSIAGKFDGTGTDLAKLMFEKALHNREDFVDDQPMRLTFTFNDSKGVSGTVISFDALIKKGSGKLEANKKLRLDYDFQQVSLPVVTYAS